MKILLLAFLCLVIAGCVTEETPEPIVEAEENDTASETDTNGIMPETMPPPQANDTEGKLKNETVFPKEPFFDFNYTDENGTWRVFFFHSPGCSACQDSYPIIGDLKEKYPEVSFINYSLATQNGSKAYVKFAELHNLSTQKQMVPQVLVNGTILTDRFNIEQKLGPLLENLTK